MPQFQSVELFYAVTGFLVAAWSIAATAYQLLSAERRERAVLITLMASLSMLAVEVRIEHARDKAP